MSFSALTIKKILLLSLSLPDHLAVREGSAASLSVSVQIQGLKFRQGI